MRSFQKVNKFKRILQSKPFLVFLGVIIFIFIFSLFGLFSKMQETLKNKTIVQEKIIELEKSKENLTSLINNLETEKGIEENIREKFGLGKEGEDMIIVIEDKSQIKMEAKPASSGFFSFFKNLFK